VVVATLAVNIAANVVSPANGFASAFLVVHSGSEV
jgi:cytosine/uracil/thiamine/allantoin permease